MVSMNVSLTPELMKAVKKRVKSGQYSNASEVVREALRNMDYAFEHKLEKLRSALKPAYDQVMAEDVIKYTYEDYLKDSNA